MSVDLSNLRRGDVIVTRSPGFGSFLIRLGERLMGLPAHYNHVVVYLGNNMVIEAAASGMVVSDASKRKFPRAISNVGQPKTDNQREFVCNSLHQVGGSMYDWGAILDDAGRALRIRLPKDLFTQFATDKTPPGFICSALADWAYHAAGLPNPGGDQTRFTTPSDWEAFIKKLGWDK